MLLRNPTHVWCWILLPFLSWPPPPSEVHLFGHEFRDSWLRWTWPIMKPQSMPLTALMRLCVQHPSTAECLQLLLNKQLMHESDHFTGSAPRGILPGEQLAQHSTGRETSLATVKSLLSWKELLETARTAPACGAGGRCAWGSTLCWIPGSMSLAG